MAKSQATPEAEAPAVEAEAVRTEADTTIVPKPTAWQGMKDALATPEGKELKKAATQGAVAGVVAAIILAAAGS